MPAEHRQALRLATTWFRHRLLPPSAAAGSANTLGPSNNLAPVRFSVASAPLAEYPVVSGTGSGGQGKGVVYEVILCVSNLGDDWPTFGQPENFEWFLSSSPMQSTVLRSSVVEG